MGSAGLYSAGRMSSHFTQKTDSGRKFVAVNGAMLKKTVTRQTEVFSLFFAVCSTAEFHL